MSSSTGPLRARSPYATCGGLALFLMVVLGGYAALVYGPRAPHHALPTVGWLQGPAESPHLALGTPVDGDPTDDDIVLRDAYVVDYNRPRHGANWSAWRLERADLGEELRHVGPFLPDPALPPAEQVTHHDYDGSGMDRGHLTPSGDRTSTREANDATFLLANVLPQRPALNRGPWEALEKLSRKMATHGERLFITAGPLWGERTTTLGTHGVPIPIAFWKVVVILPAGAGAEAVDPSTHVLAAIMPNDAEVARHWTSYQTSLGEVEHRSGYRMLGRVPEEVRARLRTKIDQVER